ncbi:Intraflagellar transport protein 52 [Chamberlinius hualienensis]
MSPSATGENMREPDKRSVILFDASKNEICTLNEDFKLLSRSLKANWKVLSNKGELTPELLNQAKVLILAGPREPFNEAEFEILRQYLNDGGNILLLLGEGGEKRFKTNINLFLAEIGIGINNDSVVRTLYYKYFHPKECLISNGVLNRAIAKASGKTTSITSDDGHIAHGLTFLYPFGATLNVRKPAVPVLSTGSVSFPLNRPVCAFYHNVKNGSKVVVLGSVHILTDKYLGKEENSKLKDIIFQYLTSSEIQLNAVDGENPEVSDYHLVPDTAYLSEKLMPVLQGEEVPTDYMSLMDSKLFQLDMSSLPTVIKSYEQLNVKHESLKLIPPQFETPLPPLQPALFPPTFRELPNPSLELFDLDEAFSSEESRLAQLTNKCADEDLEYYIRECGDVLGVSDHLANDKNSPKKILEYVFFQLVEFKKLNQEPDIDSPESGFQELSSPR